MKTNKQYKHLNEDQRNLIEYLLNQNKNFSQMETIMKIDRTTISKEIRKNYIVKIPTYSKVVCENQINCNNSSCNYNKKCYKAKTCPKLSKPPYVCNGCSNKVGCKLTKHYYFGNEAHKKYLEKLRESRLGYDILEEDILNIEKVIVPLIKDKKQPISHIFENNKDILFFSKPTFYRYINDGVLSLTNIDLPKKVSYKPRKHDKIINEKKYKFYKKNRTFDDYLEYLTKHPNSSVVEMDTVEGVKGGKCFLTLYFKKTSLLLIFLLDSKSQQEVTKVFTKIKDKLGIDLYRKIFQVILTDNGSEFLNPSVFERDFETGKKISKLFYCNPYCSYQKPEIERSHEFIRIVLPKGTSFNNLTQEQVNFIRNNIANTYMSNIKKTPYQMTKKVFPQLLNIFDIIFIHPNEVTLSKSSLNEVSHE